MSDSIAILSQVAPATLALLVREHDPEPTECLRRDARTKLGDVAFQIGANEVEPPSQADTIR